MRKNLTELVFILDGSGSMAGLEDDTIGGFNSMLRRQMDQPGEALVSTVVFADASRVVHDRAEIHAVRPLDRNTYRVGGSTALLDAVGDAIHHIGNVHKYARNEDVPEHTLFVITTDGMENASHRYTGPKVREMVERQKAKYGWEFLFLGANIDAAEAAGNIGIGADRAVKYKSDAQGTRTNFNALSDAVCRARASIPLDASWKARIEEDEQNRK